MSLPSQPVYAAVPNSSTNCSAATEVQQARRSGRQLAAQAATLSLAGGGLLLVGSLGGLGKPDYWPSLGLGTVALYSSTWLYGGWAGVAIRCRHRPAWLTGAACGVLTLGTALLVGCGWNFVQEAGRFAPFPGTTGADFRQHVQDSFVDYVGKPLVWVMPLGSVLAALLGGWTGRRVQRRQLPVASLPASRARQ